jgi:general secretion pathway protein D
MGSLARSLGVAGLCFVVAAVTGCAAQRAVRDARELVAQAKYEEGLKRVDEAAARYPQDAQVRAARLTLRDETSARLVAAASAERAAGRDASAEAVVRRLLSIDPSNARAQALLLEIERDRRLRAALTEAAQWLEQGDPRRALALVEAALKDQPRNAELRRLQRDIELRLRRDDDPTSVRLAETRPVTLEFRDANVRMIFEALSRTTGINFIVDKDVRPDLRTTIFLRQTRIEDALNLLMSSSQLAMRVLDPNTVLIYPNTAEKAKEFQDLLIRGFYLINADAKQTGNLLRSMLKLREVFVDEKLNLIVVRDSPEAVRLAERLVAMHDLTEPEVMLEVEVLEVKSSRLLELGVRFPDSFSLTPLSATGGSGQLTLSDLRNINDSRVGVSTPSVLLNFKREVGDLNVLANPRIRARNKEKARILIGDRVPVITTTTSSQFVTESVQYVDVGIKLEVEPSVSFDDEVAIKVALEVSSLAREIRTSTGSLAYQIGTRSANTALRLRDGETQLMGGLISNEDRTSSSRVPGAGDLPLIGRLFSSQRDDTQKTEIVLSITPRLIRPARLPDANQSEFWSGTETTLRGRPLTLAVASPAPAQRQDNGVAAAGVPAAVPVSTRGAAGAEPAELKPAPAVTSAAAPGTKVAATTAAREPRRDIATPVVTRKPPAQALAQLFGPSAVNAGDEFEVQVRLRIDGGLRAMPLQIGFDPARLQVVEVTEGGFLKHGGGATSFSHQVVAQEGRVQMSAQRAGDEGIQGEGLLATIKLKAASRGTASVSLRSGVALGVGGVDPDTILGPALDVQIQ